MYSNWRSWPIYGGLLRCSAVHPPIGRLWQMRFFGWQLDEMCTYNCSAIDGCPYDLTKSEAISVAAGGEQARVCPR